MLQGTHTERKNLGYTGNLDIWLSHKPYCYVQTGKFTLEVQVRLSLESTLCENTHSG